VSRIKQNSSSKSGIYHTENIPRSRCEIKVGIFRSPYNSLPSLQLHTITATYYLSSAYQSIGMYDPIGSDPIQLLCILSQGTLIKLYCCNCNPPIQYDDISQSNFLLFFFSTSLSRTITTTTATAAAAAAAAATAAAEATTYRRPPRSIHVL
jgi:hypothetical protein